MRAKRGAGAGWVTPAVMEELGIDPAAYQASGHTLAPITGFVTGLIGEEPVETRYDAPVSYGIRRCEFDAFLLAASGARIAPLEQRAAPQADTQGSVRLASSGAA